MATNTLPQQNQKGHAPIPPLHPRRRHDMDAYRAERRRRAPVRLTPDDLRSGCSLYGGSVPREYINGL